MVKGTQAMTARTMRADPCAYCLSAGGTVDHIEPRVKGGTSDRRNLTGCCPECNGLKGDTPMLLFLLKYRFPLSHPSQHAPPGRLKRLSCRKRHRIYRAFQRLDYIERLIREGAWIDGYRKPTTDDATNCQP